METSNCFRRVSSIKNNPLKQTISFDLINARFIKLKATGIINNEKVAGFGEVDVITK